MRQSSTGQVVVEYLLMTLVLLFGFIVMYRSLQHALGGKNGAFERAGKAILKVYY